MPEGITAIGKGAFEDCKIIERVNLPNSLKTIGEKAFSGSSIKCIDIPDGVETIEFLAFSCCRQLEKVTFGAGIKRIAANAFSHATELRVVVLNEGLTEMDRSAFGECSKLKHVQLPRSLQKIPVRAFDSCYELKNVYLHSGIREIGECAFAGSDISTFAVEEGSPFKIVDACLIDTVNKKLVAGCPKSVIPSDGSVTSIAEYAFDSYDFGGQAITIPLAITVIEADAFSYCKNLVIQCEEDEDDEPAGWQEQWYAHPEAWDEGWDDEYVPVVKWGFMPPEIRAERERAIREEEEAEERFRLSQLNDYVRENGIMSKYVGKGGDIVIPPDVKIILAHAFDDCDNVKSVKIHYFVECIEEGAFEKFKDAEFYFQADKSPKGFRDYRFKPDKLLFGFMSDEERDEIGEKLAHRRTEELALRGFDVQHGYIRAYKGTDTNVVLPYNDATTVDKSAFRNNGKIVSVHFGSINEIWDYAFADCVNLEKVVMPDTLTRFHFDVFCNCPKLNIERFPALLREVGAGAFINTGLEEINLYLNFIGSGAFKNCQKLKRAVINNDGHCEIQDDAFAHCANLKEVELNFEAANLSSGVFEGCSSLTKVKLPQKLKTIGHGAFKDCKHLSSIQIPSTVTEICSQAFLNCKSLQNLTIPGSVASIGDGAFLGSSGWTVRTTITLPKRFKNDIRRIFGEWKDPFEFNDGPTFKFI